MTLVDIGEVEDEFNIQMASKIDNKYDLIVLATTQKIFKFRLKSFSKKKHILKSVLDKYS